MAEGSTVTSNSSFTGTFTSEDPSFSSLQQKERIKFWNQRELEKLKNEEGGQITQQQAPDPPVFDFRKSASVRDLESTLSRARAGLRSNSSARGSNSSRASSKGSSAPSTFQASSSFGSSTLPPPQSSTFKPAPKPQPPIYPKPQPPIHATQKFPDYSHITESQPTAFTPPVLHVETIPESTPIVDPISEAETKEAEVGDSSFPAEEKEERPQDDEIYTTPLPHQEDNISTWMDQAHDHFRSKYHYPRDEEAKAASVSDESVSSSSQFSWLIPGYSFRDQAQRQGVQLFYKMKSRDPPTGSDDSSSQAPWNIDPLAALQDGNKSGKKSKKTKAVHASPPPLSEPQYSFGSWVPSPYLEERSKVLSREPARIQNRKPLGEDDTERWVLSKSDLEEQRRQREEKERLQREKEMREQQALKQARQQQIHKGQQQKLVQQRQQPQQQFQYNPPPPPPQQLSWEQQQRLLIQQRQQQLQQQHVQFQQSKQPQPEEVVEEEIIEEEVIEEEFVDDDSSTLEDVSTFADEDITSVEYGSSREILATFPHQQTGATMNVQQLPWNQPTPAPMPAPVQTPVPAPMPAPVQTPVPAPIPVPNPAPARGSAMKKSLSFTSISSNQSSGHHHHHHHSHQPRKPKSTNMFNSNSNDMKWSTHSKSVPSKASMARNMFRTGGSTSSASIFSASSSGSSSSDDSSAFYDRSKSWDGFTDEHSDGDDNSSSAKRRRRRRERQKSMAAGASDHQPGAAKRRTTKAEFLRQQASDEFKLLTNSAPRPAENDDDSSKVPVPKKPMTYNKVMFQDHDSDSSSSLPSLPSDPISSVEAPPSDASSDASSSDVFADEYPDILGASGGKDEGEGESSSVEESGSEESSSLNTAERIQRLKNMKYEDTLNVGWTPSSKCIGMLVLANCGMIAWGIYGILWLIRRDKNTAVVAPTSAPEAVAAATQGILNGHHNIFNNSDY